MGNFFQEIKKLGKKIKNDPLNHLEQFGRHIKTHAAPIFFIGSVLEDRGLLVDSPIRFKGSPVFSIINLIGFIAMFIGTVPAILKKKEKTWEDWVALGVVTLGLVWAIIDSVVDMLDKFKWVILAASTAGIMLASIMLPITLTILVIDFIYSLGDFIRNVYNFVTSDATTSSLNMMSPELAEKERFVQKVGLIKDGTYLVLSALWIVGTVLAMVALAGAAVATAGTGIAIATMFVALIHVCLHSYFQYKKSELKEDEERLKPEPALGFGM